MKRVDLPMSGAMAAHTPVSGMIHALTLLAVLLDGAPIAGRVSMAVLAAILFLVAAKMGEWHEIPILWRQTKTDVSVWLATFALTVLADLAVEVGTILAPLLYIRRVSNTSASAGLPKLLHLHKRTAKLPAGADSLSISWPGVRRDSREEIQRCVAW